MEPVEIFVTDPTGKNLTLLLNRPVDRWKLSTLEVDRPIDRQKLQHFNQILPRQTRKHIHFSKTALCW